MKSRKDAEMIRAYQSLLRRLQRAGITPRKHVLDNEVSESMKELIRAQHNIMELEMVPPGCHRRNAAKVAIRNFKAHFLSILAGVADDFPKNLWDRLLPHAEITINLLRQSNATPTVSAYAHMSGPFDYNKMPLAPMGCKVQVHKMADKRDTWAFHSVDGWYLATSHEHYRTHRCHIKDTQIDRFSDTVQFQHKNIMNPTVTPYDKLMRAVSTCAKAFKGIQHIDADQDIRDLQRITTVLHAEPEGDDAMQVQPAPRVQQAPRVNTAPRADKRRVTRSMTQDTPAPTQPTPRVGARPVVAGTPRRIATRRRRQKAVVQPVPATAPANNTRSKTRAAAQAAARLNAPPASGTRAAQALRKHAERMAAAKSKPVQRRLTRRVARLENEVQRALAVMGKQSGRMLNYRQLMQQRDYKHTWSISSANEFGRLANGIGGRIKNPTNTIEFIRKDDVPHE